MKPLPSTFFLGNPLIQCSPCRLKEFIKEQLVYIPAPSIGPTEAPAPAPPKAPVIPPDDPAAILAGLL